MEPGTDLKVGLKAWRGGEGSDMRAKRKEARWFKRA